MDFESIVSAVPPPRRKVSVDTRKPRIRSVLRSDDRIELRDIRSPGYGEGPPVRPSPGHPECITGVGEDGTDVIRVIREHVARILATVHSVDHATAVGVDQPAQQHLRIRIDDPFLPTNELYPTAVLRSWSVLRKHARPVIPARRHHDAARCVHPSDGHGSPWSHGADGSCALIDDPSITSIQRDTRMEGPRHSRDATITQVHPEEIRVRPCGDSGSGTSGTVNVAPRPRSTSNVRSGRHGGLPPPVTYRPPSDPSEPGDLTVVQTPANESVDLYELPIRSNGGISQNPSDPSSHDPATWNGERG